MKKIRCGLVFSFIALIAMSCENFTASMKDFFIEYADSAAVINYTISTQTASDKDGVVSLPADGDVTLNLVLRNPQKYFLDILVSVPDLGGIAAGNAYTTSLDPSRTRATVTLKKDFLAYFDQGKDISPTITLRNSTTQRTFTPYKITLRSNTPPPKVSGAVVKVHQTNQTYVLCFSLGDLPASGIHSDVRTLKIGNTTFPLTLGHTVTIAGLTQVNAGDIGDNPLNPGAPLPTGANLVYYDTGVSSNDNGNHKFSISLIDEKGLSSLVQLSNKVTKLKPPTITHNNVIITDNDIIWCKQGEDTASITITAPAIDMDNTNVDSDGLKVNYALKYNNVGQGTTTILNNSYTADFAHGTYYLEAWSRKSGYANSDKTTINFTIKSTTFYVASTGNDTSGTGISTNPYKTVTKALTHCTEAGKTYTIYITGVVEDRVRLNTMSNRTIKLVGSNGAGIKHPGGSDADQVIHCGDTANNSLTLTIENLTISGGKGGYGAGLSDNSDATITIKNCTFKSNSTGSGEHGAAICYRKTGGALTIENSIFENNTAGGDGCIYTNASTTTIKGCTIKNNTATGSGGGVYVAGGTVNIIDTTIGDKTASATAESNSGKHSNKASKGAGIYVASGTVTITGSFLNYNYAANKNAGEDGGATLYVESGTCTLNNTAIAYNNSTGSQANMDGGGVYVGTSGTCTITNSAIKNNTVTTGNGGGVYTLGTCTINGNTNIESNGVSGDSGEEKGGGVFVGGGTCNISGSTSIKTNNSPLGKGVYVHNGIFAMSGAAKVEADNDVYLKNDSSPRFITIAGALTSNFAAKITSNKEDAGTVVLKGDSYTLTEADCNKFALVSPEKNIALSGNTGIIGSETVKVVTADTAVSAIGSLSGNAKVKVVGPMTTQQVADIGNVIKSGSFATIELDLSGVTGLTEISYGEQAFINCTKLSKIILPEGLTTLNNGCFTSTSITSLELPSTLTTINANPVWNCNSLTSVTSRSPIFTVVNNDIIKGDTLIAAVNKSGSYTLPNGITKIGNNAFTFSQITSIDLANVTEIGDNAFTQTKLAGIITIPSAITKIPHELFGGNKLITAVICEGNITEIGEGAFRSCKTLTSITINSQSLPNPVKSEAFHTEITSSSTTVHFPNVSKPAGWPGTLPSGWDTDWKGPLASQSNVTVTWKTP